jgi:hypothetical protein
MFRFNAQRAAQPFVLRTINSNIVGRQRFQSSLADGLPSKAANITPIGVQAALMASSDPTITPKRTIFSEFSLRGRVSIVTGGKRGIGLELAMALAEAGSSVHCIDLQSDPGPDFEATKDYVDRMRGENQDVGTLSYVRADVSKQREIWDVVESIASEEGRLDIAFANAGIPPPDNSCLEYKDVDFQKVRKWIYQNRFGV